jgi:fatty acid desaturase
LFTIHSHVFLGKLAVWGLLVSAGVLAVATGRWPVVLLGQVILGLMFVHAVELQHQCLHQTAFRSRGPHRWVGVLLGLPMLVCYSHYRARHLHHHRWVGTERDREFFAYDHQALRSWWALVRNAWNPRRLWTVGMSIAEALRGVASADARHAAEARAIRHEYLMVCGLLVMVVTATVLTGSLFPLLAWLMPLLLVAEPVHFLIELPEHFGCDRPEGDVLANTRSIDSNRWMAWFTNGNNFHVEHHYQPQVPVENLPALHELLRPAIKHRAVTYRDFLTDVVTPRVSAERDTPR